ncbi:abasic site processing protein HMCES isoform X2 [Pelodiscus sinensis]|uniref:abasic site processing protein HMCES isoform X2 n=1 Tax=Pelodiscus sinensis TaxID=13735 RepID=UPI000704263B|nr:embryonic stem cell-specific 5-hydroxymethylcytosine-binding protein isoform X2 [Pelodiscus sinensis]|eukprot:XP_014432921.1 embryonic stem cell-specific 5-hydroxymethylcytosine-binding protein isoform X2 [Pelodiscus sinensis]
MCGRTACALGADGIRRACVYRDIHGRTRHPEWRDADKYSPSYNKSPQSNSPVLLSRRHFEKDADSSERVLAAMRWGLVPSWFRESDPSKMQYKTSNCRSDTMMEKLSYKADGKDDDEKWKSWKLLTMAGIFDCWEPPGGGDALYTYTIITVDASKSLSAIHNRMPAILDGDEAIRKWLDFPEVPTQEALRLIHSTENIAFHPVSAIVNNSRNNTPECLAPIELELKKETKASTSSKMMLNWLKNKSPKKEEDDLPRWSSQFIQITATPKRSSASLMQQWLKKEEEDPCAKKPKTQ